MRRSRAVLLGCALTVFVVLVRSTVLSPAAVHGGSMQPTLRGGDVVLVAVWPRPPTVSRGDLIAFTQDDGETTVKRAVALAGQRVALLDGVLQVDGAPVAEPYLHPRGLDGVYFGPVVVPAHSIFVLGDNRTASVDSRDHGPVDLDAVIGRVVLRVWPPRT